MYFSRGEACCQFEVTWFEPEYYETCRTWFGKGVFKILECRSRRMAGKQWIQHHRSYQMASFRWALLPWKKCKEVKVIAMTQISWLGKSMGISNYLFLGELQGSLAEVFFSAPNWLIYTLSMRMRFLKGSSLKLFEEKSLTSCNE